MVPHETVLIDLLTKDRWKSLDTFFGDKETPALPARMGHVVVRIFGPFFIPA